MRYVYIICLILWLAFVGCSIVWVGGWWHDEMHHCANMTTDMEITLCMGDINPADPCNDECMEDQNAYTYNDSDYIN